MDAPNTALEIPDAANARREARGRAPLGRRWLFAALLPSAVLLGAPPATAQPPQASPAQPPQPLPEPPVPGDLREPPADAFRSPTGLVTRAVEAGTGNVRPDANDLVSVHYIGWTPYGAKFQSSYQRGQAAVFKLATLLPVWSEAIQMMVVGERRRLWVPENLAPQSDSAPRGPVVFDFELLGIRDIPDPPAELRKPPADAEQTDYGIFSRRLAEGTGDSHPGEDDLALMHWTGWSVDGKTFDSTFYRGRPTAFPLDKVLPAFADVARRMVIGEKRQIWIPGDIAAGQWPGAPPGQLILEVELVRVMPGDVLQPAKPPPSESGS